MQINLINVLWACIGFIISSILFLFYISKLKKEIKATKRQYEKKSIGADDSALRIKTLENKIKTLETALKKSNEQ